MLHRRLALHLLIGGACIAALFGAGAYLARYHSVGQEAVIQALGSVEQLRQRVRLDTQDPGGSPAAAIQRALDAGPDQGGVSRQGRFVFARFYAPDGRTFAQRVMDGGPQAAQLAHFLDSSRPQRPPPDEPWIETTEVGGRPHIHVVLAVTDRRGGIAAYGEGLYAVSDAAIASARQSALAIAGIVFLIVMASCLLLYPIIRSLTRRLGAHAERLLAANLETAQVLGSAIAQRDSDTDAHNFRVTLYALHLAEASGMEADRISALIKGAFLHDVGKIGVRDHILHKPGKLDADEFTIMKTHVDHGLQIIQRSQWLNDAADVVGAHHEKFDGSGYPRGLRGEAIPLAARVFAICDVFDALTSRRPYKEPFSLARALQILAEGRGTHFDPVLVDRFAGLADALHARYGGREDAGLREELAESVRRYFTADMPVRAR